MRSPATRKRWPLSARGPGCFGAESSEHLHHPRHRRAGRQRVHRHGVSGGHDAEAPHRAGSPMETGDVAAAGDRDCRRARCRARQRHRPSRHQAREHFRDQARDTRRFWTSAWRKLLAAQSAAGWRRADSGHRSTTEASDQPGHGDGHGRVYVAGAGARAKNWMRAPICFRLARCCTRWRPARCRFAATRSA